MRRVLIWLVTAVDHADSCQLVTEIKVAQVGTPLADYFSDRRAVYLWGGLNRRDNNC